MVQAFFTSDNFQNMICHGSLSHMIDKFEISDSLRVSYLNVL